MKCNDCGKNFKPEYLRQLYCGHCLDRRIRFSNSISSTKRMLRNREFIRSYKKNKSEGINNLMKTLRHPDIIKSEIEKCILLCPNCHNELHFIEKTRKIKK
jgi:hypothetical protein